MRSKGKRRANLPLRGGKRTKFVGSRKVTENFVRRFPVERRRRQKGCISNRRSLVCMFSLRAKGAILRFYHKRRPSIFLGAHHRCEAAYKICGEALTTPLPPFGTAYHLSTRTSVGRQKESASIFLCPLEGNAAKQQRVYGGKNDDVALILPYAAPYFARLAHPMQDVHSGQQGVLELGP